MSEKKGIEFLKNIPRGKDLFENKSQDKIASILVDIIQNKQFQIIGIDGAWGSGKSNLVKILENKLKKSKFTFFIYDVWGHQEDEQRRAILEELTEFIAEKGLVKNKDEWKKKLKILLGRERETTITNIPHLSIGFIVALLSIVYTPAVNIFKESIGEFLGLTQAKEQLILVFLPLLSLAAIFIYYFVKLWCKQTFSFFKDSKCNGKILYFKNLLKTIFSLPLKETLQETFQIYTEKQKSLTKIETISESEPSVKEFRNWMKEIDSDLSNNNKKLILVFDNFDRLPKAQIIKTWSSIHIFFSEDKYKNIKVIIPFDRAHINNAFEDLNGKIEYTNDYINKTFDLVYRVSLPILSEWKVFFRERINETNIKLTDEEYFKIEQIFEVYCENITPREIIAFINEFISIKLLDKNIPERYIALFILNKEKILKDPLLAITEAKFLGGLSYLYKDQDDFQKYITALVYQISANNSLEVVYRKQIKEALVNNNEKLLNNIAKTNVFEKIIQSVILELDNFENPILAFHELSEEANLSKDFLQTIWNDIYLQMINKQKLDSIEFSLKGFQEILIVKINPQYSEQLIKQILNSLYRSEKFSATDFVNIVDKIESLINERSLSLNISALLKENNVSNELFIPLINHKKSDYSKYKITCSNDELDTYLGNVEVDNIKDTFFVEYLIDSFKFQHFEKSLKEKISENSSDKDILANIFKVLKIISTKPINIPLEDNEIHNLFNSTKSDDEFYADIIAMILAKGNSYDYSDHCTDVLNDDYEEIIAQVAQRIEYFINFGDFLINSIDSDYALYKSVVKNIVTEPYGKSRANILTILNQFKEICVTNDLEPQTLIQRLDNWKKEDLNIESIKGLSSYYFEAAINSETELAKISINLLTEYFDNLDKEVWKSIFADLKCQDYKNIKIIEYRKWNSHALEALKDILVSNVNLEQITNREEITNLVKSFETSGKELTNTFKDIRDALIKNNNINTEKFILFVPWLFKYASIIDKSKDVIRTIFKTDILDNEICLKIILDDIDEMKKIKSNVLVKDFSDFEEGIKDRLNEDSSENLKNLAKELGIRKRIIKKEESEDNNED